MSNNNQTLVYDIAKGAWVGVWEGLPATAAYACVYQRGELDALMLLTATGSSYRALVPNAWDDDGTHPSMVYEYVLDLGDQPSRSVSIEIDGDHHHGAWLVRIQGDGYGEKYGPVLNSPNPAVITVFGSTGFDLTNPEDNQAEPWRENYGVLVAEPLPEQIGFVDHTGEDIITHTGEILVSDEIPAVVGAGIYVSERRGLMFGIRQQFGDVIRFRKPTQTIVVRIQTMRGSMAIHRIGMRAGRLPFTKRRRRS